MWSTENKSGVTPRLFIANQKLPLETGLEKQQRWQQCLPVAQHSWPSMEIRELCCIIWPLTPGYPILITWKNCIHPGKMYSPQGVHAWDYLPVLRKGRAARHRDGHWACRETLSGCQEPCSAWPPPDSRHFLHTTGRSCKVQGHFLCPSCISWMVFIFFFFV